MAKRKQYTLLVNQIFNPNPALLKLKLYMNQMKSSSVMS